MAQAFEKNLLSGIYCNFFSPCPIPGHLVISSASLCRSGFLKLFDLEALVKAEEPLLVSALTQ